MRIDGEFTMSFCISASETASSTLNATVAVAEVVRELLDSGIAKDFHLLAYNALPFRKLEDLIAV